MKNCAFFCMKPDDPNHDKKNKFHRIEERRAWHHFCASTAYIQDVEMRKRLVAFITATPDPFVMDVFYHKKCWDKSTYRNPNKEPGHIQNIEGTAFYSAC